MEQRHLILIDEQSQSLRLKNMAENLKKEGIELIYKEINPTLYTTRQSNGDAIFDKEKLRNKLDSISFKSHLYVFATDYNLIEGELKGIDMIEMLYSLVPYYKNKVVIYSAQIEDVITNVINSSKDFEQQINMLKLLSKNEIHYLGSENEFEQKFKRLIEKEADKTIDTRLAESLLSIDNDKFKCSIPGYTDKKLSEIGELLLVNGEDKIALRKKITEHFLAYISSIRDYE